MPVPTTDLGKRLVRWQLSSTAPAPLNLDHPVQVDLAAAADEIERLHRLLAWCAPRLKLDDYRKSLWDQLNNPRAPDHAKIVQSQ